MNFPRAISICFVSIITLGFLFFTSSSFGFQRAIIQEEHENQRPPLSLIGVVVSENASSSVAVLHNKNTGKQVMLMTGESFLDLKLTHVLEDGIILTKGRKIYWLFLRRSGRHKADDTIQKSLKKIVEADQDYKRSKSVGEDNSPSKREFIRSEVQKRVKREWPLIIKDTNVVPNYVDGKMNGFRVVSLPRKSIASEIGIYKDDVIREVNGVKFNNLSTLVSLHSQIFVESRFEVLIERDKKLIRQVYVLK